MYNDRLPFFYFYIRKATSGVLVFYQVVNIHDLQKKTRIDYCLPVCKSISYFLRLIPPPVLKYIVSIYCILCPITQFRYFALNRVHK